MKNADRNDRPMKYVADVGYDDIDTKDVGQLYGDDLTKLIEDCKEFTKKHTRAYWRIEKNDGNIHLKSLAFGRAVGGMIVEESYDG